MSWKEQQIEAITSLAKVLRELTEIEVADLVHRDELGSTYDFSAGVPLFEQTILLMKRLKDSNFHLLPTQKIRDLADACRALHDQFQQIRTFSPDHGDPRNVRDSLIASVDSIVNDNFLLLTSVIAASGQDEAAVRAQRDEVAQMARSIKATREQVEQSAKETGDRSKTILDQAQTTAASVGIHSHAKHFQEEAERDGLLSGLWFVATSVLIGAAAYISYWTIGRTVALDAGWVAVVQMTVGRFSLMAIAYFAAIWASRMYRAARHNQVVNRHRVNALRTFETFASAARDDAARDAVLLRATECIFSHQASGFSDSKSETGSTKILNAVPPTLSGHQPTPAPGSPGDTTS